MLDFYVPFAEPNLATEDYWRAIILQGRNVASCKFVLAKSLLALANSEREFVPLDELATPFARHVSEHLKNADKQGTFSSSTFLDACRVFNRGDVSEGTLRDITVRRGFNNVIDAFHGVHRDEVGDCFLHSCWLG